jgi:hypothetical protein
MKNFIISIFMTSLLSCNESQVQPAFNDVFWNFSDSSTLVHSNTNFIFSHEGNFDTISIGILGEYVTIGVAGPGAVVDIAIRESQYVLTYGGGFFCTDNDGICFNDTLPFNIGGLDYRFLVLKTHWGDEYKKRGVFWVPTESLEVKLEIVDQLK